MLESGRFLASFLTILAILLVMFFGFPGVQLLTVIPMDANPTTKTDQEESTSEATQVPTETSTVQATNPPVCQEQHGQITAEVFSSKYMGEPLQFNVYLPPCYDPAREKGYPVLYMFHGQSYNQDQWIRLGLTDTVDQLTAEEQIEPFIIIMPFEKNSYANPFETGFEKAIIDELIPWVEKQYDVCKERNCRAAGGLSRGAAWAIHLGLTYWKLFGQIGAHSAVPFEGDPATRPGWLAQIPRDQMPEIYMDIGQNDLFFQYALRFSQELQNSQIPHQWLVQPGTHDEVYWHTHIRDYVLWYSSNFEAQ